MSEELLKALMQLFALIVKQGSGVQKKELEYVSSFLNNQLTESSVPEYMDLFYEYADIDSQDLDSEERRSPSVKESVKILGICKRINRTLTQKQKLIVLVRLFELLDTDKKFTFQRMTIINTVAEVFNISQQEFDSVEMFIRDNKSPDLEEFKILRISLDPSSGSKTTHMRSPPRLSILWVESVDLYFIKHNCIQEVFLNGLVISPLKIYLFSNGSSIHSRGGKHIFYSDISSQFRKGSDRAKIEFQVKDLSYKFSGGTYGIRNISFVEKQGRLVSIMGASGTGKTTLINLLSGLEKPTNGKILVNGQDLVRKSKDLKDLIGFIPQDDLLIEELTVYQNLFYNAKLCFRDKPENEIHELVLNTLVNLGLGDKKDLKVGAPRKNIISGGQRKRLNIALELIREPSILFVDEPTSGLSSRDSENVLDLLRELTQKGKLIFVVIHQPSSDLFKLFDNLLLLDEGGRMIYYGNPVESVVYFKNLDAQINPDIGECPTCGNVNPEQLFNIIEKKVVDEFGRYTQKRKVSPEKWESLFLSQQKIPDTRSKHHKIPSSFKAPNWFKQLKIFLKRDLLAKFSNKQYLLLSFLEAPALALLLSFIIRYIADPESNTYIYRENENIPIYIFISLIVALFIALTISAEEIFRDRKILKREKFLNLNKGSYLLAKILILLLISAIQVYSFVIIGNSILGIKGMNFYYWAALFTTAAFANMLGLNISASFNSAITIYIIIPLLVIPMMVLSGAMFSFDKLNRKIGSVDKVPMVAEIMATKWTYEGLMVHQFKNNKFQKHFFELEKTESQADFIISYKIKELKSALNHTVQVYNTGQLSDENPGKLDLIRNEISKESAKVPGIRFDGMEQLTPQEFSPELVQNVKQYLDELSSYYTQVLVRAQNQKEKINDYMLSEDPDLYKQLKDDYYNEYLADIVKKRFESNYILEYKNNYVQQYQPIFQVPEPSRPFQIRTHFFAPEKFLFGKSIDTFWFNILIVWIMTGILFFTLYFELLKRVVLYFENLKFRK